MYMGQGAKSFLDGKQTAMIGVPKLSAKSRGPSGWTKSGLTPAGPLSIFLIGGFAMWMLTHANGYSLDVRGGAQGGRFDAIVMDSDRIVAVGSGQELTLQFGGRVDKVLDVGGATVVPGLVDSHLHVSAYGQQALRLNLVGTRSKAELLTNIRNWAAQLPATAWVVGGGWDDNRFVDKQLPSMAELNEAAGGRPLVLTRICCHAYLANEAAFFAAGLGENPANPADGAFGRDAAGRLNGLVYENAAKPLLAVIPPFTREDWYKALKLAMQSALAAGLTAVHTDDTRALGNFTDVWQLYHHLTHDDGVFLRVHELVDWSVMDEVLQVRPQLPQPDLWLEQGAAKLFSDGALGGRTAWFSQPYSDAPDTSGTPMYTQEELNWRVRHAHEQGFPVAIHAIGDAALDATLTAMELAPAVAQRDRLIHAENIRPDLLARMVARKNQMIVDIQPRFVCSDFPWVLERVGPARAPYVCAWKTMQEAGLWLCGGSDAPIEPFEPLLGIHAAVTRRPPFEARTGYAMEQALSPLDAVRLFGHSACVANHSEHQKGQLLPGWLADLTILDKDIVNPNDVNEIRDAKVLYTVVGGHIAYAADGAAHEWWSA